MDLCLGEQQGYLQGQMTEDLEVELDQEILVVMEFKLQVDLLQGMETMVEHHHQDGLTHLVQVEVEVEQIKLELLPLLELEEMDFQVQ